jgi:hypothetical protein
MPVNPARPACGSLGEGPVSSRPQGGRHLDIRISKTSSIGVLVALLALLGGCGGTKDDPGGADTSDQCRLSGRVLDATGAEIPRRTLYLHFFADDQKLQKTLDPAPGSSYEVLLPRTDIRIRVHDTEATYALLEQQVSLTGASRTLDLELEPTNYVRMHGSVIDGASGEPIHAGSGAGMGNRVRFYFQHEGAPAHPGSIAPEDDGTYAIKLPRGVIKILAVDTALRLKVDTVDLSGASGPDRAFDIVLVK